MKVDSIWRVIGVSVSIKSCAPLIIFSPRAWNVPKSILQGHGEGLVKGCHFQTVLSKPLQSLDDFTSAR